MHTPETDPYQGSEGDDDEEEDGADEKSIHTALSVLSCTTVQGYKDIRATLSGQVLPSYHALKKQGLNIIGSVIDDDEVSTGGYMPNVGEMNGDEVDVDLHDTNGCCIPTLAGEGLTELQKPLVKYVARLEGGFSHVFDVLMEKQRRKMSSVI